MIKSSLFERICELHQEKINSLCFNLNCNQNRLVCFDCLTAYELHIGHQKSVKKIQISEEILNQQKLQYLKIIAYFSQMIDEILFTSRRLKNGMDDKYDLSIEKTNRLSNDQMSQYISNMIEFDKKSEEMKKKMEDICTDFSNKLNDILIELQLDQLNYYEIRKENQENEKLLEENSYEEQQSVNSQLVKESQENSKIQENNNLLNKQILEQNTQLELKQLENEQKVEELNFQIMQKSNTLEEIQKNFDQNSNQDQQANKQLREEQNQLEAQLLEENSKLSEEIHQLQAQNQKLNYTIEEFEQQIQQSQKQIQEQQNIINDKDEQIKALQMQVQILNQQYQEEEEKTKQLYCDEQIKLNSEINSKNQIIAELNDQLEIVRNELKLYQNTCQELQNQETLILLENLKKDNFILSQQPKFVSKNPYPTNLYNQCLSICKELLDYQINIQEFIQKVQQLNQQICKPPIALLISESASTKQQLIHKLQFKQNIQLYKKYFVEHLENYIIDTDEFDFENNIDERERQIKHYQRIFKENPYKFNCIWIAVKFERAYLMKKSIMSIYKFVYKLKIPISIIVTDFHLSEDQEKDKKELRTKLKLYNPKHIIFVGQFTMYEELIKELEQALPEQSPNQKYPMNLEKTIFEDQESSKSMS